MKLSILVLTLISLNNLSWAADSIPGRESLDFYDNPSSSENRWFVHHLVRQDFPQLSSEKNCERVAKFADETYLKPAHALGLKAGIWIKLDGRCGLRIILYPGQKEQLADYNKFVQEKQDQTFESKTVHIYAIRSVHSDVMLRSGIIEKPGDLFVKVVTTAWRPSAFATMPDFKAYITKYVGPKILKTIEADPKPFLSYVTSEFSPEYAKEYEEFLRQSNSIDVFALPSLGLDDGSFEPYGMAWGFLARCHKEFPNCRLGK